MAALFLGCFTCEKLDPALPASFLMEGYCSDRMNYPVIQENQDQHISLVDCSLKGYLFNRM
jgi:hypothetical protein